MNWLKSIVLVGALAIAPAHALAGPKLEDIKSAGVLKIGTGGT